MKSDARVRARKAVDMIRRFSVTMMATWNGNLYKRCLEGVAEFERLRPQVKPATEAARYASLMGQQIAGALTAASLDNVLTVLIGETADHKWQFDIVADIPGLCFGSPVSHPLASREEAEKGALGALGLLGASLKPADEYEPENLDHWLQIRVNQTVYHVAELTNEQLSVMFFHVCRELGQSEDEVQISCARMLLEDAAGHRPPPGALRSQSAEELRGVALAILANCGWTHVSADVVEGFAAANGVDLVDLEENMSRYGTPKEAVR
jgi:hypothetical protein